MTFPRESVRLPRFAVKNAFFDRIYKMNMILLSADSGVEIFPSFLRSSVGTRETFRVGLAPPIRAVISASKAIQFWVCPLFVIARNERSE